MKLKISDISRMTGLSASGIRFYEKAGVIAPRRAKNQKYRDFSMHEIHLLLMCKKYRDCGFTLQESVDLVNCPDTRQIRTAFEAQAEKLEQEIRRKLVLLDYLRDKTGNYACTVSSGDPCFEIARMPAMIRVKLWQPGSQDGESFTYSELPEWLDLAPFVESSLLLTENALLHGTGELPTDWGLAIREEYANSLGFTPQSAVQHYPSCDCIRTCVRVSDALTVPSRQFTGLRNFLEDHNLRITAPAISRLLYVTNHKDNLDRLDSLYIPVSKQV